MSTSPITYNPRPSTPKISLPKGACDSHCHVFGPQSIYPYAEDARFEPGDAPREKLFELHDMLGIDRCVIVQSGCHGFDNSVTADAIAARRGRYLGIALLPVDVSDSEIQKLDNQGFRGVRFNYMAHLSGGVSMPDLVRFADRLQAFGWHLQIHMDNELIAEMAPTLSRLPVTVVVDHMGRIDASKGVDQAPFNALRRLLEHEHVWVKVSGCERCSRQDVPYADAVPFAHLLVETYSDRVIWGTDWPHPNFRAAPPNDGHLVDLLADIAPSETHLKALLVDNPMKLYGFEI